MNFPIINHVKRNDAPFNMEQRHYHNQYEIYYLLNGERNYFINQRSYHVKKGDLVLIDKNILHKTTTIDKNNPAHERILIQFSPAIFESLRTEIDELELFEIFTRKNNLLTLNPKQQLWLEEELFKLLAEKETAINKENMLYIKIIILEILIFIKRISHKSAEHNLDYPDQKHENISKIASYINKNFNQDLSLDFLAAKFNYSPAYLSRAFKEVTGFNFVEYKNNLRVKEAGKLLQQTELSVTNIAAEVGYNNLTHFGRIFKKISGLSPLEYRKLKDL